jgi:AcrR family transcriptional regulator
VIEAALRLMDEEGLEAVTMRRIAKELGVEAMSLYHHVEDKEDLLDGICERVMSEFRFIEPTDDWAEDGRRGAREWRRLLRSHPNVMRLFAEQRGPIRSIESLRPMEYALALLRRSGIPDRDVAQAFHAFGGYIQGFVMMELGSIAGGSDETQLKANAELAQALPEDFPTLEAVLPYFVECPADEQFEFGLDLLIRGLEAKARSAGREPASTA